MKQDNTLSKREYLRIRETAVRDYYDALNNEATKIQLSTKDKRLNYARNKAKEQFGSSDSEAARIYIGNFFISNNKKLEEVYFSCEKSTRATAEYFDVDVNIIFLKIIEIATYGRFYDNNIVKKRANAEVSKTANLNSSKSK
jgi:nitrogen-specific signal transduction histidine kinase